MPEIVIATGPLFDGRAHQATANYCRETEGIIAMQAVTEIRAFLPTQYKYLGHGGNPQDNPVPQGAGHYEASIRSEMTVEGVIVSDDQVIYGPWLEGVSERNQASRFKGYGAFRKISQQVNATAGSVAELHMPQLIMELSLC
jgi:hypothetical protein